MTRKTLNVFKSNEKTANGRIYTSSVISKVVAEAKKMIDDKSLRGECDQPDCLQLNLDRVSHIVTDMSFDEVTGEAKATIETLNTPYGSIVEKMLEGDVELGLSPRGTGTVDKNGVVSDYKLYAIDLIPASKKA